MKCFVIAMEKEAAPLLKNMDIESDAAVFDKRVVRGKLYGKDCAVVICGVGKVNAACGAQLAIDTLGVDTIINLGVAGGLNDGVEVGEIYSISAAVQYDFDLTQLNGTKIGTLDECEDNYIPLYVPFTYPKKLLGTGDRFNDSKTDYLLLTKQLNADIRDMEGCAIAQTCMHAGVKCCSVKIISDLAGSGSTTEQYLNNLSICFERLERELKTISEAL